MEQRKNYGRISFLILAAICLLASVYPGTFPTPTPEQAAGFNMANIAWILSASGLVMLMTPGLSFFYGGMVQSKNLISTMLQSFIALGVISVVWYVVGFSLAFGDSLGGFVGNPMTFFMFNNVGTAPHPALGAGLPLVLFAMFQMKFAIITPALFTGSFAERVRFWSYVLFMVFFSLLIYAPLAHWTWHPEGFLFKWGVLDFAGGTVVHISAGFAALAGAMVLGRRKVHQKGESHTPGNIPFVLLGTGLLWFGWFGFNAGSALAADALAVKAFVNTMLASAVAMLAWILVDNTKGQQATAMGACIGAVVGLVAITPAAGYVNYGASIFIGFVAAIISNFAVARKVRSNLDDTLDVFPCHGVGGIVGMIMTAIFAEKGGLMTGETTLFSYHMLALVIVSAYTFVGSYLLFKLTDLIMPLRVSEEQEELGLDLSQHNESVLSEPEIEQLQKAAAISAN